MSLDTLVVKTKRLVQDTPEILKMTEYHQFVLQAVTIYGQDKPCEKVAEINGDGSYDYTLPNDWKDGVSIVIRVEYPAGERIPVYIEAEDWCIYDSGSDKKLRFLQYSPSSTEKFRLTYTIPYDSDNINNIPQPDQEAIVGLAASLCCEALANYYAQTTDATISADAVNYQDKSRQYSRRGKELRELYNKFIGKKDGEIRAAGSIADWDVNYPWGGDRLTHPKKQR